MANKLITTAADLVTTRAETRAGFISMALEKNNRAVPFVEEAKMLKALAGKLKSPNEIPKYAAIRAGALTASGLSDKSLAHLTEDDQNAAILAMVEKFLMPAGNDWVDELVYRFLLIKGDSLGGQMRNVAGALGARKFMRAMISVLNLAGINYYWGDENGQWSKKPTEDKIADLEQRACDLCWEVDGKHRLLLQNYKVPLVGNNVDLILFDGTFTDLAKAKIKGLFADTSKYVALGELKGGIDPAGADEHWKTANTALGRIRARFKEKDLTPATFFVGAAIETAMSKEIFTQLQDGTMTDAANLTNNEQLAEICSWVVNL